MIFQIEESQREGARLVLGLAGVSGSGKTFTALQIAWGLANYDSSKVGLMCTENRRGRLYSDILVDKGGKVHRFKIGDLTAPFSPQRYIDGIDAFVKAGVEVLVIDSVSHEWEGMGGCESIALDGNPKVPRWNVAKRHHKGFMNVMLSSPLHVIACMRAREKVKVVKKGADLEFEPLGILPICEKNFTFELTASMMLHAGGKQREVLKCPAELEPIFGKTGEWAEGYLAADAGKRLREWVDGANKVDDAVKHARDSLQMVCEKGMAALSAAWDALPKKIRSAIGADGLETLKASAAGFDRARQVIKDGGDEAVTDLNNAVLGSPATTTEGTQ